MSTIYEDTRQQVKPVDKHAIKHDWWRAHGVEVLRQKLSFGDYSADGSNVCVDSKANVDEVAKNINGAEHDRFIRECERAAQAGYRLVFLVENDLGYDNLGDVVRWTNGHCVHCGRNMERNATGDCKPLDPHGKCPRHGTRKPIQGPRLYKAMRTIEARYLCSFEFCAPDESARRICELLGVGYDGE